MATGTVRSDSVTTPSGRYEGTIKRIDAKGVTISIGVGETVIDLKQVAHVDLPRPAALDQGITLMAEGNHFLAAATLQPVVERFATVRVPGVAWAGEAILKLGDAYVGLQKYPEAERMYEGYGRLYGGTKEIAIKQASIQFAQGNCSKAQEILNGLLDPMLKQEWWSDSERSLVVEGIMLRGSCLAKEGKLLEALDAYLLVVALFDGEPHRTMQARLEAGRLFVRLKNKVRAAEMFREIIAAVPDSPYKADAQKELATLEP
jgi:tetratricopeptide (TPR) repeat protein